MTSRPDLLLHPIRLRIVQVLAGAPATPQQIKDRLDDVPIATLYRHVKQLTEGGLIEAVDERPVRGTVERTYAIVADAVALDGTAFASATTDDHFRYFATFVGALLSDFTRYLHAGDVDVGVDGVGYRQVPVWLTDEEFDELLEAMRSALEPYLENEPTEGRRRRRLTGVVVPDRPIG